MAKLKNEQEAIDNYDSNKYITPDGYTSDIAVFTIISEKDNRAGERKIKEPGKKVLKIMLIKRAELDAEGEPNIEGEKWALPGGFNDGSKKETAIDAAARELEEETGVHGLYLKHFGVYDEFGRDKRGWIISNAHYAIVPEQRLKKQKATDDAEEVQLFTMEEVFKLDLAFDHRKIISDALKFIEKDLVETKVARNFLREEFTLSELQGVLMTVSNNPRITNKSVFFTKVPKLPFIEKVFDEEGNLKKTERNSFRPSQLYKFNDLEVVKSIWE
ncbi:NUDIX domain-containing protein [Oceanobacillus rekensis]|uniref:NUDIX domain-containing protein n=1 Tax=Oceanobacillus rekensis TaxID=937927 RepID=UPI000B439800|nr:NUDIX domain-containing protein [Oceanobacillus rekensis]